MLLPPVDSATLRRLESALALVPERHQEDAAQEAWVAYLENDCPIRALKRYVMAERRYEKRQVPLSQLPTDSRDEPPI